MSHGWNDISTPKSSQIVPSAYIDSFAKFRQIYRWPVLLTRRSRLPPYEIQSKVEDVSTPPNKPFCPLSDKSTSSARVQDGRRAAPAPPAPIQPSTPIFAGLAQPSKTPSSSGGSTLGIPGVPDRPATNMGFITSNFVAGPLWGAGVISDQHSRPGLSAPNDQSCTVSRASDRPDVKSVS